MQTLHVNGYDMAYLDVGQSKGGPPLVCVHGSLNDFRIWGCVIGPLSKQHRLICVSLRHFFPEQWNGIGNTYSIAQHVDDVTEGPGRWQRLPPLMKQPLIDNATTLIGQVRDDRPGFSRSDAESIGMPTLFIGGAKTKGLLPKVLHTLAAHVPNSKTVMIPNTTHPMFEQAPQAFSEIVLSFLAD
jgi:pimeloyl-ACP methyl ester carboxylesterase